MINIGTILLHKTVAITASTIEFVAIIVAMSVLNVRLSCSLKKRKAELRTKIVLTAELVKPARPAPNLFLIRWKIKKGSIPTIIRGIKAMNSDQILPCGTRGENKKEVGMGASVAFRKEISPITKPRKAPLRQPSMIEPMITGICTKVG